MVLAQQSECKEILQLYDAVILWMHKEFEKPWWFSGWYPNWDTVCDAVSKKELYLLKIDDQIAAVAVFNHEQPLVYQSLDWEDFDKTEVLVIHTLAVHPSYQGRGLTRKILEFAEQWAKKQHLKAIRFDTFEYNLPAQHIYQTSGYQKIGVVDLGIEIPYMRNFYCYQKLIG